MRIFELARSQFVPRSREDIFAFFSNAENLEAVTPPWLRFRILSPRPIHMNKGRRIDYALRIHGVTIGWTSEITAWEPPLRFVDEQVRGPYRIWVHEHRFEAVPDGTRVIDRVRYAVPGGRLVNGLLVGPDLDRVFGFRREQLERILGTALDAAIREQERSAQPDQLRTDTHDLPGVGAQSVGSDGASHLRRGDECLSTDHDPGSG
jgi:ligand-binding SRPBCC domain-containing protein